MKKDSIIPHSINLQERLAQMLNVKLQRIENVTMKEIRLNILKLFYSQNGIMTFEEFDKLFPHYPSGRHKSFRTSKEILEILLDHVKIPKDKLKNNFFILSADPDNLRKLLSIKHIGGVEIEEIMRRHPMIMISPHESVLKILSYVKDFGFSEDMVANCLRVLLLNPETVHARLTNLNEIKTLQFMKDHPRVLSLISNSSMVAARLKYLKLLNVTCFSHSILTGPAHNFVRFSRQGEDKHKKRDCVAFLAKILDKKEEEDKIEKEMSKHQYWLQISNFDVKETVDELQNAGFSLDDIYSNIHIVLYSAELIFDRLKQLNETEQIEGISVTNLSKSMQLKIILYAIELDYHYTGDGVWEKRRTVDRLELCNIELPDMHSKGKVTRILDREKL